MIQDWANDNVGSIELSGNLAAVGQRHLSIQSQMQQVAAMQTLAEAQRRQQLENALLEERQNILYDISAALEDIKSQFNQNPSKAYYDFLVLEEFVSPLGLEHRLFPSLEWKNHCNKTLAGIGDLRAWCNKSLDEKHIKAGTSALAQRKLAAKHQEEERIQQLNTERLEAWWAEEAKKAETNKRQQKALIMAIGCFAVGIIAIVCAINFFGFTDEPFGVVLVIVGLASLIGSGIGLLNLLFRR